MTDRHRHRWLVTVLCAGLTLAILAIDLAFPLGIASGVLYVVPVLLSRWLPLPRAVLFLAAIATALIIAGFFLSPPGNETFMVLLNRGLSILAVWMTALLSFFHERLLGRLRDNEARLRAVTDTAIDGIVMINSSGTIQMVNPACERLFGYKPEEMIGRNVKMLMPSPDHDRHDAYLRRYLEFGERRIIGIGREVTARHKDGTEFPVRLAVGETHLSGQRLFTGFIHDMSARKQAEHRVQELQSDLYRVSRLGELGEMAAMIAHEVNQPLTAVNSYLEASRRALRGSEARVPTKVEETMAKAMGQAQRASEVIRHIRALAQSGETERVVEDINAVIEEVAGLALLDARAKGIDVTIDLAEEPLTCHVNRTQIQQVVLNLIRNGVEAMDGGERPSLIVRSWKSDGEVIQVSVADNGPGLPDEIRERLFKPFVTTKPDGLGIGLSTSYSIIESHGGRLWADSNDGGGTVFHFSLPEAERAETGNGG